MASDWQPGFSLQPRLRSAQLLVGEWCCSGQQRGWAREVSNHAELAVHLAGSHLFEVDARRHVVHVGMVTMHRAEEQYRRASPSSSPQRSLHVFLRGALAEAMSRSSSPRAVMTTPEAALLVVRLLQAEVALEAEELAWQLAERLVLVVARERALPPPPPRSSWRRLAEGVQHELATRFAEPLSLEAIGSRCGASVFHLSRVFRAVTGTTVHRALTRVRLRAALLEIAEGRDLTEVALAVGFSSHSHLSTAFYREYGLPPSRLRRAPTRARF
jgi:AraC family transcriptional regulator